ncbi:MAG TPA: TRAP transporter substrate-binding protein DctP, partial [Syntrophorhabdaceae bacterium]|nr:TRAP transporter substrate-binding protein DctP [Syntrophorhabdaceae bacterium]
ETNGRVKFKPFWGGALMGGKDTISEVVKGVVDIGFILPGSERTGFDIAQALGLFMYGADQKVGRRVFLELLKKYPEMAAEYKTVKVLAWTGGTNYQIIARKPVNKLDDLKGMRVRATGDMLTIMKNLGAEGVSPATSEVYMSLQKGILDAGLLPLESLKTFRFAEVAKFCSLLGFYKVHVGSRAMNLSTWNKLPDDIKKIFENNIEFWGLETDKMFEKLDDEAIDYAKNIGVKFTSLSKEDVAKFNNLVKALAQQEEKKLDAKGLPGSKIHKEAQLLIQKYSK